MAPPLPDAHRRALRWLLARLAEADLVWALTGSTSFALQGVPVTPHDIDIQTDAAGAYALALHFPAAIMRPVTLSSTATIRSHFGVLTVAGLPVEIMGAVQKRLPNGTWEAPVDVRHWRRWVPFESWRVPVLDLTYEARAYRLLGRLDRAALLEDWLAAQQREVNDDGQR